MENRKKTGIIYIFLFVCLSGLLSNQIVFNNIILKNLSISIRLISFVFLLFAFGYKLKSTKDKNGFIIKLLKIYLIMLVIISLFNFHSFKDMYMFKIMSFISFLSPIIKTTSIMNQGCFILPTCIMVSSLFLFIIDKYNLLKNKKNKIIIFSLILLMSFIYGFICSRKNYFLADDRFLNIFNPFNILLISFAGFNIESANINNEKIKKIIIPFLIICFFGIIAFYVYDNIFYFRFRIYLSLYLLIFMISIFFMVFKYIDIDTKKLYFSMFLVPFVSYFIFNYISNLYLKLLFYILLIITLVYFIKKIDLKPIFAFKKKKNYSLILIMFLISIGIVYFIGRNGTRAIISLDKVIKNKKVEDVTSYLDPIVDNTESTLGTSKVYSYMYVDDYKRSGFLSNSRFRYRTVPNEMINFNMVSRVFNYGTDDELKEFLCNIKVDYIIVRKSKRVEKIMNVNVPKEGLIYKKNNDYCSQNIKDYFIRIEEETK